MKASTKELKIIIEAIAQGNQKALERLFDIFYDRLFLLSKSYLKSSEIAEEVVADVFFNIWKNRERLPSVDDIVTYMYVSVKNQSLSYLRKKEMSVRREQFNEENYPGSDHTDDPENKLISSEEVDRINRAISELPEQCRIIFRLAREDRLPYKEIAEILGISVKTIDSQIAIALKKISSSLFKNQKG